MLVPTLSREDLLPAPCILRQGTDNMKAKRRQLFQLLLVGTGTAHHEAHTLSRLI